MIEGLARRGALDAAMFADPVHQGRYVEARLGAHSTGVIGCGNDLCAPGSGPHPPSLAGDHRHPLRPVG